MAEIDLTDWRQRIRYARDMAHAGPLEPTPDHLVLLHAAYWDWDEAEFGAPAINPKRPYGNSDVEGDLAELLPHLSEQERLRVHCELPAVLAWLCQRAGA